MPTGGKCGNALDHHKREDGTITEEVLGGVKTNPSSNNREFTIDELEDQSNLRIIKPTENPRDTGRSVIHNPNNPALKNEYYLSVNSKAGLNNIDH